MIVIPRAVARNGGIVGHEGGSGIAVAYRGKDLAGLMVDFRPSERARGEREGEDIGVKRGIGMIVWHVPGLCALPAPGVRGGIGD